MTKGSYVSRAPYVHLPNEGLQGQALSSPSLFVLGFLLGPAGNCSSLCSMDGPPGLWSPEWDKHPREMPGLVHWGDGGKYQNIYISNLHL